MKLVDEWPFVGGVGEAELEVVDESVSERVVVVVQDAGMRSVLDLKRYSAYWK